MLALGAPGIVMGCAEPTDMTPPVAGPPIVVLKLYLEALVRGDCGAGKALGTGTFRFGNGELCGSTTVTSATIDGEPATPNAEQVVFATTLVTTGTDDRSIAPGEMTWFYTLRLQADGTWRITGGGSGP